MPGVAACAWPTFAARSHPGTHRQCALLCRPPLETWHEKQQHANVCLCRARATAGVDAAERPATDLYSHPQQAERSLDLSSQNGTSIGSGGAPVSLAEPLEPEAAADEGSVDLVPPSSTYTKAQRKSLANIPESEMTPEELRRWRISKANRGKTAWNNGRRHSPGAAFETAQPLHSTVKACAAWARCMPDQPPYCMWCCGPWLDPDSSAQHMVCL